jgi:hypothetical protein
MKVKQLLGHKKNNDGNLRRTRSQFDEQSVMFIL